PLRRGERRQESRRAWCVCKPCRRPPMDDAVKPKITPKKWSERLKVHPAADMFPPMPADELLALGNDMKENGLRQPILLFKSEDGEKQVVDGRNRLDAAELVGLPTVDTDGQLAIDHTN